MLVARISLTLSRHSSLSFIALGRSSGQHPVSLHSCWMYVRAGRPAFARPCVGIHKSTSLMSSSLLLQQWYIYIYIYIYIYRERERERVRKREREREKTTQNYFIDQFIELSNLQFLSSDNWTQYFRCNIFLNIFSLERDIKSTMN